MRTPFTVATTDEPVIPRRSQTTDEESVLWAEQKTDRGYVSADANCPEGLVDVDPPAIILLLSVMDSRFTPPTRAQQLAAIGSTTGLQQPLQRALEPRDDFLPIPKFQPTDRLLNHSEAGQTFDQFTHSLPNRPDDRRSKLYLQPLGRLNESDGPALDQLRRFTPFGC